MDEKIMLIEVLQAARFPSFILEKVSPSESWRRSPRRGDDSNVTEVNNENENTRDRAYWRYYPWGVQ
jgi:hypothetical protein